MCVLPQSTLTAGVAPRWQMAVVSHGERETGFFTPPTSVCSECSELNGASKNGSKGRAKLCPHMPRVLGSRTEMLPAVV